MDSNPVRETSFDERLSGGCVSDARAALKATCDQLWRVVRETGAQPRCHICDSTTYVLAEAMTWLASLPPASLHAVVTDPPYGLVEYEEQQLAKRRNGRGGVWRIPPAFDGAKRAPLPRFTVLTRDEVASLKAFFQAFAVAAKRVLVPGGHIVMASNPLLSTTAFDALQEQGLEKRGEIIRLVQTLRGGDRPKGAEGEFADVSMMPRSCWEPWGIFRKPFEGTAAENLRTWGTGGLRRPASGTALKDVIPCAPTRGVERDIAPHPSLKPQRFMRQVVRAVLPLGIGIVADPFAGSGSTLAAAAAVGYRAIGADHSAEYFELARTVVPKLAVLAAKSAR